MDDGTATLDAAKDTPLRVERIETEVKSAGFTPRGMVATAVGTVVTSGELSLLEWHGGTIELEGGTVAPPGRKVRARGTLTVRRDGASITLAMEVADVEPLEP